MKSIKTMLLGMAIISFGVEISHVINPSIHYIALLVALVGLVTAWIGYYFIEDNE